MDAKTQLIEYAASKGHAQDAEAWLGQATLEGITISRTPTSRTVCNIKRQGKTITVTETTVALLGLDDTETRTTIEIMRVEL